MHPPPPRHIHTHGCTVTGPVDKLGRARIAPNEGNVLTFYVRLNEEVTVTMRISHDISNKSFSGIVLNIPAKK